jgi:hypothetical protein
VDDEPGGAKGRAMHRPTRTAQISGNRPRFRSNGCGTHLAGSSRDAVAKRPGHASVETTRPYMRPAEMMMQIALRTMPWAQEGPQETCNITLVLLHTFPYGARKSNVSALALARGGSGKTTSAVNPGHRLALAGPLACLLGEDTEGHLATVAGGGAGLPGGGLGGRVR